VGHLQGSLLELGMERGRIFLQVMPKLQYIQLQAIDLYRKAAESGKASFLVGTLPGVTIGR
jgi:hypothetical protein